MEDDSALPPDPHSRIERRVATILHADVAGYSRLMGENEERTIRVFRGHREIFESLVKMHRGRIFNTAGDAILAEFQSSVEAVRCATEIQAALHTRNEHLPQNERLQFRIGINLGDVILQGGDMLGDGVNVAARVQTAAEPGGISISGSVYDQIQNKLSLNFQPLGEKTFKNIAQTVRTYSIVSGESSPSKVKMRWQPAGVALVSVLLISVAGYAAYQAYQAYQERQMAEAAREEQQRRAQRAAEEAKKQVESLARQQAADEAARKAAEAGKREAALLAQRQAAEEATRKAAEERKRLEDERRMMAAEKRTADARLQAEETARKAADEKKRLEDERRAVAAERQAMEARLKAAAAANVAKDAVRSGPAADVARFDGTYSGRMCNLFRSDPDKRACWPVAIQVQNGTLTGTWKGSITGRQAWVKGTIGSDGVVTALLDGWHMKTLEPVGGTLAGKWADDEINLSGAWATGQRVSVTWKRDR